MSTKHNATSTTYSSNVIACEECGMKDHLLLHNIRYCGNFRNLCTTCILRLHPKSFCPTCFQVYPPPPNGVPLTCVKCGSLTHSRCVVFPPSPYICPLCVSPKACIFKSKMVQHDNVEGFMLMDRDTMKKFTVAAKIVSILLSQTAMVANEKAERKANEAVLLRKKAKEALKILADVAMKEKSE